MDVIRKSNYLFRRIASINYYSTIKKPLVEINQEQSSPIIDKETIKKLEKISLVAFEDEAAIKRLEAAIKLTEKLKNLKIDESIEPMYSVLENQNLQLRNDEITETNCLKKILKNAKLTEEDYFIAPPGNVPN